MTSKNPAREALDDISGIQVMTEIEAKHRIYVTIKPDTLKYIKSLLEERAAAQDGVVDDIKDWINALNISVAKGLIEDLNNAASEKETTLAHKKNRGVCMKQAAECLKSFVDYYEPNKQETTDGN